MMSSRDRTIAVTLKERLVQEGVPIRIMRVFGSRARGDNSPESDLDIFLLLDAVDEQIEREISRIVWEVGYRFGIVITTVEYTSDQLERSPLRVSPFVRTIQEQGISI